jgi:mannosyltransferase OCH1-like enzyme
MFRLIARPRYLYRLCSPQVIRLEALLNSGGIYLDIDIFVCVSADARTALD